MLIYTFEKLTIYCIILPLIIWRTILTDPPLRLRIWWTLCCNWKRRQAELNTFSFRCSWNDACVARVVCDAPEERQHCTSPPWYNRWAAERRVQRRACAGKTRRPSRHRWSRHAAPYPEQHKQRLQLHNIWKLINIVLFLSAIVKSCRLWFN